MIKNWKMLTITVLFLLSLTFSVGVPAATTENSNISSISPTSASEGSNFTMDISGSGLSTTKQVVLMHKGCKAISASQFSKTDNQITANFYVPYDTGKWTDEQREWRKTNWCLNVVGNRTHCMMCGFNIT